MNFELIIMLGRYWYFIYHSGIFFSSRVLQYKLVCVFLILSGELDYYNSYPQILHGVRSE